MSLVGQSNSATNVDCMVSIFTRKITKKTSFTSAWTSDRFPRRTDRHGFKSWFFHLPAPGFGQFIGLF